MERIGIKDDHDHLQLLFRGEVNGLLVGTANRSFGAEVGLLLHPERSLAVDDPLETAGGHDDGKHAFLVGLNDPIVMHVGAQQGGWVV